MTTQAISGQGLGETNTMNSTQSTVSNKRLWAGRIMSGLPTVFLLMDGGMKLFKPAPVVETTLQLGFPESAIVGIGVTLLISTILYMVPRTAILGAILLTATWAALWRRMYELAPWRLTFCFPYSLVLCSGVDSGFGIAAYRSSCPCG